MLTLQNLQSGYIPGVNAVSGINLEVGSAGAVGLMGRNGAGKTCLALTVIGTLPVNEGDISIDGVSVRAATVRQRIQAGLALVPEGRRVFSDLTVQENLKAAAYGAGVRLSLEKLEELVALFPVLGRKAHSRAGLLSGGEQQMLAIGRAVVQQPRYIILDEPTLGLAPVMVDSLADGLRAIMGQGVGLIVIEQNRGLLTSVCEEIHVMHEGVLLRSVRADALQDADLDDAYLEA